MARILVARTAPFFLLTILFSMRHADGAMKLHILTLSGLLSVASIAATQESATPSESKEAAAPAPNQSAEDSSPCGPSCDHTEHKPLSAEEMTKASYFIGRNIGGSMASQSVMPDTAALSEGLKSALEGKESKYPEAELKAVMESFQKFVESSQRMKSVKSAEAGQAYLVTNGKKAGVTTTASGLQYEVLKKSEGAKPKDTDSVKVHYHGTLIDGKVFDSSVTRGEPVSFPLNGVIKGWTEGVQLMPVGSKYKFTIPSDLAYGEQAPPSIGANQTLIFEVELIAIEKPEAAEPSKKEESEKPADADKMPAKAE
jgi:FKBP-type peptidyl-prolyl cis-trans isomerase FklB